MSFRYDVINLEIIDDLKALFAKPTTQWTDDEVKKANMILMAIQIAMDQRK